MSTPTPISGVKVKISTDVQPISITNTSASKITTTSIKEVSNYEYEILENEKKRKLLILKPEYLAVFISDMKNIMKYAESSQYVDQNTKRGYNPKVMGV
jgi:CRISPR/Cas system CMR-associated protein Cmr3 (group 5 of RAMP superfamily)